MEDGLVHLAIFKIKLESHVLILVVVEDGLVHVNHSAMTAAQIGLNPCCSGRWSRTQFQLKSRVLQCLVLILVVVEDGLVPYGQRVGKGFNRVLILVVVEDGLVQNQNKS